MHNRHPRLFLKLMHPGFDPQKIMSRPARDFPIPEDAAGKDGVLFD
jgi:hypothetical protein